MLPRLPSTPSRVPSGHGTKSSILYLHSPTVRPKDIVRLSGDPLIQDSLTYDDASTFLDNDDVPLGEFLDRQISRVIQHDVVEYDDELEIETPETAARTSLPRYELPKVPEGYVMNEETTRDILCL